MPCSDLQSYDNILSITLANLGKLELPVRDVPKGRPFWVLEREFQAQSGVAVSSINHNMVQKLTKIFRHLEQLWFPCCPIKYLQICTRCCSRILKCRRSWPSRWEISTPLPLILTFAKPWRCTMSPQWWPGILHGTRRFWSLTFLISVMTIPSKSSYGAIWDSRQTSAQAAYVVVAAQRCMVLDVSVCCDCQPLSAMLSSTPSSVPRSLEDSFQSSVKEGTHNQEQLSQVRSLASPGSKTAQGSLDPRASNQSQKRRAAPPPFSSPSSWSGSHFSRWKFSG